MDVALGQGDIECARASVGVLILVVMDVALGHELNDRLKVTYGE